MTESPDHEERLPLTEEHLAVHKRTVETGRVRIRTVVDERTEWVHEALQNESVSIERVPIGREVEAVPPVRQEGDEIVIPVLEEVLVVERRLILKEEMHVRKERHIEHVDQPVPVKTMRAVVERAAGERDMRPSGESKGVSQDQGGHHDDTNPDGAV
ncbi:MAG TPA: YsnF/AvaK domain-containing protein [Steroidobacteraceae bacterium]|nr:YsnF/AvaK domain-containing protein [Steroidobacteraceae bacterium]